MARAHFAFACLGDAGDSNGRDFHERTIAVRALGRPINRIHVILTDAHGEPVCITTIRHPPGVDRSYNWPERTPCHDRSHWTRARQVYHDRDNHNLVESSYNAALRILTYRAPLHPPPVPEDAGGE